MRRNSKRCKHGRRKTLDLQVLLCNHRIPPNPPLACAVPAKSHGQRSPANDLQSIASIMAIKRRSSAPTITDVLRQHIDTSGDCHVWLMGHNGHGRPVTYIRGKAEYVYRVLYEEIYGAITLNLCHRCDNPGCVNLEHVFEGTLADNNRDSALKGRKRGERHSRTSFTDDDIRALRSKQQTQCQQSGSTWNHSSSIKST